jgi:DNA-binding PadR family transcriptional regulator
VIGVGYDPAVRNRAGDMTPQMMVLGTLAAGPGTVREIQKRLVHQWPSADFSANAAHSNLPVLEEQGYVRLVEEGGKPSQNHYAISEAGWAHIREWVSRWPPDPANREAIHGKAQFATLQDLPELVRMVRDQQERCQAESDKAHGKLLSEQRLQSKLPPRDLAEELGAALRIATLRDLTLFWGDYAARRKAYGDALEEIHQRFSTKAQLASTEG